MTVVPVRPWGTAAGVSLMAVVNLNDDSFSDPGSRGGIDADVAAALAAVEAGAGIVDLGAQSAALAARLVPGEEQRDVLLPVVRGLVEEGVAVSVDTYDPVAALAVLEAGAVLLNDYSGEPDRGIVEAVADEDAWYVLTHNPVGPRHRQTDEAAFADVVDETIRALTSDLERLEGWGLPRERVVCDPGVDVGKTPAQTLELLRGRDRVRRELEGPLLWAIGRKDVLGALTGRRPADRDAATLALVSAFAGTHDTLLRVHAPAEARDVLTVEEALRGVRDLDGLLDDALRRQD